MILDGFRFFEMVDRSEVFGEDTLARFGDGEASGEGFDDEDRLGGLTRGLDGVWCLEALSGWATFAGGVGSFDGS